MKLITGVRVSLSMVKQEVWEEELGAMQQLAKKVDSELTGQSFTSISMWEQELAKHLSYVKWRLLFHF